MAKPAVGYVRVSTERQGKSGLGLDAQEVALQRFAQANRYELLATFSETESGKGPDALERRPKLAEALKLARKVKGPVIVAKLDRLSRDVHFISGLMRIACPSSSPSSVRTWTRSCCTSMRRSPRRSGA